MSRMFLSSLTLLIIGWLSAACGEDSAQSQQTPPAGAIVVAISAVVADDHETAIHLEFHGAPAGTRLAAANGQPQLTDTTGQTHRLSRVEPAEPGRQVWVFPPVPEEPGELVLEIPGLQLVALPTPGTAALPVVTAVPGRWTVRYSWDGHRVASQSYTLSLGPVPYGPGTLTLETVTVSEAGVVVDGYIDGFTLEEVPELVMFPPTLVLADGTGLRVLSGSNGGGDHRERFSFRFAAAPSVDGATLTVPFAISDHPRDTAAATSLRERGGPSVSLVLDTP